MGEFVDKQENNSESVESLNRRINELQGLVDVISRGKYQWEAIFDAITAPVMIVSSDYYIKRANIAFAGHCGIDVKKIPGRLCYEVFADRDKPCEGCPMLDAISRDDRRSSFLENDAKKRMFEANSYPVVIELDGTKGAVLSYRDITEERRLQRELVQQEKMAAIGILAGGVAHEINNPLGGILAFTQLLLRNEKITQNEDVQNDLREIENAAVRCKKIVADLLDFSRMSKERERGEVDINKLLTDALVFVRREIQSLNVELDLDMSENLPRVIAIPDRLQQVFLNLMTNACHAMKKGGKLSITTFADHDDQRVVVELCDNGVGMPENIRDKIFDPFFTTKKPGEGTGLGLSISYRIVKEHGGTIDVESEPGKGTKITVSLPVHK